MLGVAHASWVQAPGLWAHGYPSTSMLADGTTVAWGMAGNQCRHISCSTLRIWLPGLSGKLP